MITIIDYGMGNLRSVQKGFERVGHAAEIVDDPRRVKAATKLVLPGVGAFEDAMAELQRRRLIGPVLDALAADKPFLGICLGLQLLFETSYENGTHRGLGAVEGEVVRFQPPPDDPAPRGPSTPRGPAIRPKFSIPQMGWNQLAIRRRAPVLEGIADGAFVYFVHSYYVVPRDPSVVAAETDYPAPFCSMIWRGNLFATQFHPEKSQAVGLRMLKNFAELPEPGGSP